MSDEKTITQLMEYVTSDLVTLLMNDTGLEAEDAMNVVYNSCVFQLLHDAQTGLYREGAVYVFDLLQNEMRNGKLMQEEI